MTRVKKIFHQELALLAMFIEKKLTAPNRKSKRKFVTIFILTIFLLCTIQVTPVFAGEGVGDAVNDQNTIHETAAQVVIEMIACAVMLKILEGYRIP